MSVAKNKTSMEAKIYNMQGKEVGTTTLPESVFGARWSADLVHQVVTSMQANTRAPIAHTKTRGEVRGGGKKPWAQKGTGQARHGSTRSPIWVGGGISHGPRNARSYVKKVNRSMRQAALRAVLSRKARDGELILVENIAMQTPKAAEAKAMLAALSKAGFALQRRRNAALIALPAPSKAAHKSFRNFGNVAVEELRNINPVSVLSKKYLVIANPKAAFEALEKSAT
ncbi:MAG: 50S ribosomal protein L4 [Patescibacteria group bacterium]|nr:50S ribosomal protein L4 [Patescibacteria group bacterium]